MKRRRFRNTTTPLVGLISAEALSLAGNQIAAVAIPIVILQYTHSPLTTGIASVGNILPIVLSVIAGGRAIDRFGAWSLSVAADVLSCLSVLALPLALLVFSDLSPVALFLLVFVGAIFDPTGVAARQTLVPRLARLAGASLEQVNTLRGGIENGADFIGPLLGAGLIGLFGSINTLFVNAASFLLCVVLFVVTVPKKRCRSPAHAPNDLLGGARFIVGNPHLRPLALMGMVTSLVVMPFLALLLPVLATQVFGDTALLGLCLSAFGASATVGALTFARLSRLVSRSSLFYGGLLLTALAIVFCGVASTRAGVVLAAGLAGILLGAGNPLEQTIFQEETPHNIQGQVFTSLAAIKFAAGPLGLLAAGILTEHTGVHTMLIASGGLLLLAAIFGWYRAPLGGR